jgi:hypothetical protein
MALFVLFLTLAGEPEHYANAPLDRAANYLLRNLPAVVKEDIRHWLEKKRLHDPEVECAADENFDGFMQIIVRRWRGNPLPYPVDPFGPRW